jgi:hypothetical protein
MKTAARGLARRFHQTHQSRPADDERRSATDDDRAVAERCDRRFESRLRARYGVVAARIGCGLNRKLARILELADDAGGENDPPV